MILLAFLLLSLNLPHFSDTSSHPQTYKQPMITSGWDSGLDNNDKADKKVSMVPGIFSWNIQTEFTIMLLLFQFAAAFILTLRRQQFIGPIFCQSNYLKPLLY